MEETYLATLSKLASLISFMGFVPYIYSIFKRETIPNLVTWMIWTVVGTLICFSYYHAGAPFQVLMVPIAYVFGPTVIALLALKYGEKGYNHFDIFCLISALLSLLIWFITGKAVIALALFIFIDLFGALPTMRKVYYKPQSESLVAWMFFLVGNTLNFAVLPEWNLVNISYPLYLLLMTIVVIVLMLRKFNRPLT